MTQRLDIINKEVRVMLTEKCKKQISELKKVVGGLKKEEQDYNHQIYGRPVLEDISNKEKKIFLRKRMGVVEKCYKIEDLLNRLKAVGISTAEQRILEKEISFDFTTLKEEKNNVDKYNVVVTGYSKRLGTYVKIGYMYYIEKDERHSHKTEFVSLETITKVKYKGLVKKVSI